MPRSSDPARYQLWRQRMGRFERLELTVVEFCRREQVSTPSFYQWRKRLAHADAAATPRASTDEGHFVQLSLSETPAMQTLKLTLPGGASIYLPAHPQHEQLTSILTAWLHAAHRNAEMRS